MSNEAYYQSVDKAPLICHRSLIDDSVLISLINCLASADLHLIQLCLNPTFSASCDSQILLPFPSMNAGSIEKLRPIKALEFSSKTHLCPGPEDIEVEVGLASL